MLRQREIREFVYTNTKPGNCVYPVWNGQAFTSCEEAPDRAVGDYPYCQAHAGVVMEIAMLVGIAL